VSIRHGDGSSKIEWLTLQYTRSTHQESDIAQGTYVVQGFNPVTFPMGMVEKRSDDRIDSV